MTQEQKIFFDTQLGRLELVFCDNKLCSLSICDGSAGSGKSTIQDANKIKVCKLALQQLRDYFSQSTPFHGIALAPCGTAFQKTVWHELTKIPMGETRTYGDIAQRLNSSPRAVGNACRKNPVAIIIPCHRVVAANGLGGYAGQTQGSQLDIKRWLLKHEGVAV